MRCQMMRVISSPSSSTSGVFTLILANVARFLRVHMLEVGGGRSEVGEIGTRGRGGHRRAAPPAGYIAAAARVARATAGWERGAVAAGDGRRGTGFGCGASGLASGVPGGPDSGAWVLVHGLCVALYGGFDVALYGCCCVAIDGIPYVAMCVCARSRGSGLLGGYPPSGHCCKPALEITASSNVATTTARLSARLSAYLHNVSCLTHAYTLGT